ncbi:unnamed protein product [Clonostachys rosea]|uniref:Uncharacterized protein n=1 Tax=Bionectria ochroleuca TaxID=29856 RepID=A0ABY6UEW3_BIOOC|nr:unnamed protein product [Clonostachys rosea]
MASTDCREQVMRAPEDVVKEILLALCEDKGVEKTVLTRLAAGTKSSSGSQGPARNKRKATDDLAVCVQCKSPFYKDDNQSKDCESEIDWDSSAWVDNDATYYTDVNCDCGRKEYPEGFIWSCCDMTSKESAGCTRGCHESDPTKAFKEGSKADSDEEDSEDYEDWE